MSPNTEVPEQEVKQKILIADDEAMYQKNS